jgi:hypothetical protein
LAYVLLNNGRAAEAAEVGRRLAASAVTDEDSAAAKKLMATIAEEKEWEEESSEDSESATAGAGKEGSTAMPAQGSGGERSGRSATAGRRLPTPDWMALDGEIIAVDCAHAPEVTITLAMPKGPMAFHAKDFRRVGVSGVSAAAVPGMESCQKWTGRHVKLWFQWVQGQDYVGEITRTYFY